MITMRSNITRWKQKRDQIGGRNILSEWDLTHGIDSDIIRYNEPILWTTNPIHLNGIVEYLKEALDKYLDDYVENEVILEDILDILNERSGSAYAEFTKVNELEMKINSVK